MHKIICDRVQATLNDLLPKIKNNTIQTLELSWHITGNFTDDELLLILDALADNTSITRLLLKSPTGLSISHIKISPTIGNRLKAILTNTKTITEFEICAATSLASLMPLLEGLKQNTSLTYLGINLLCEIKDLIVESLIYIVQNHPSLSSIKLKLSNPSELSLADLFSAIQHNKKLINLNFKGLFHYANNQRITQENADQDLNWCFKACLTLLNSKKELTHLDLSDNFIRPSLLSPVLKVIKNNTQLKELNLSGNRLDEASVTIIKNAAAKSPHLTIQFTDQPQISAHIQLSVLAPPIPAQNTLEPTELTSSSLHS